MPPWTQENHRLQQLLDRVDASDISSIGSVVSGIINVINDPQSSAKDLKDIVEIDPPLSARVLRVANSAYYSPPKRVSEIQHAVILIGFDVLKELALSQKVLEAFEQGFAVDTYSSGALWKHSVAVAMLNKMIYRREFGERGENAYAAGLIHDLGIIVEQQFMPEAFRRVLRDLDEGRGGGLAAVERRILGFSHEDIGSALAAKWQFPEEFVIAVRHHHTPSDIPEASSRLACALCVADHACQARRIGFCDDMHPHDPGLMQRCQRRLNIEPHAVDLILDEVEQDIAKMENQGLLR